MPCDSSYMKPTEKEIKIRESATLLKFVLEKVGKVVPDYVKKESKNSYASDERIVPLLCKTLSQLTESELDSIVYNSRDKKSRRLADWYEEHLEADRKRIAKERKEKLNDKTRNTALAKLTTKEKKALGLI